MALNIYKEINREITIKNQQLKAELAAKNAEINQKDLKIMYYQKELMKCQEENEEFRLMVMEVIQKTTSEYNRLVRSLTNRNCKVNSNTQELVNTTNRNSQLFTNVGRAKNCKNRPTADNDTTESSYEEPLTHLAFKENINQHLNNSDENKLPINNRSQSSYSNASSDSHSDKEDENVPDIEEHDENQKENMLQLSVIDETNESCRTVRKTIRNETKKNSIDNVTINRSSSPTVGKFVTIGRGNYRLKLEKNSPPISRSDESSVNLRDLKNYEKSQSTTNADESVIDITSIPMVPSSTPLRVKNKRQSLTINETQLTEKSPIIKRRSRHEKNTDIELVTCKRPKRKVSPGNLAEPKLSTKLRRRK